MTVQGEDFEPTPCTTAEELINHLTFGAETFGDSTRSESTRFLFRGTFDARYLLLPSALRQTPPPFGKLATIEEDQGDLERRALRRFFDAAHYEGLRIPEWLTAKEYVTVGNPPYLAKFSPLRIVPLEFLALAQHHGTPTRLLDWTLDPLVAAYFAATVYDTDPATKVAEMAVWKLDTEWNPIPFPWKVVSVPYDLNNNARAQRGLFTGYARLTEDHEPVCRETMIEFARVYEMKHAGVLGHFTKYTLPRTEAPKLLRLLRSRRISGATLFPGYYGCARHERELSILGTMSA